MGETYVIMKDMFLRLLASEGKASCHDGKFVRYRAVWQLRQI